MQHLIKYTKITEMDLYTMKEFERLSKEEPDANVMACKGIQYCEDPSLPGEDPHWVRKIYKNVSKLKFFFLEFVFCMLSKYHQVKEIPKSELIPGVSYGYTFESCKFFSHETHMEIVINHRKMQLLQMFPDICNG